jgi:hypothetical protein
MLMLVQRRTAIRTLKGWATSVLLDAGAIRECEEHGWMIDRADPQTHDRAFDIARRDPPRGISPKAAAVVIAEVLESIGDTCPERPLGAKSAHQGKADHLNVIASASEAIYCEDNEDRIAASRSPSSDSPKARPGGRRGQRRGRCSRRCRPG